MEHDKLNSYLLNMIDLAIKKKIIMDSVTITQQDGIINLKIYIRTYNLSSEESLLASGVAYYDKAD